MSAHSRNKGKAGERELAAFLTERGFPARRGVQYKGGNDSPDIICQRLDGYHIEVKRRERFRLYDSLEQAKTDAATGKVPLVAHRANGKEWVMVLRLEDFLGLWEKAYEPQES